MILLLLPDEVADVPESAFTENALTFDCGLILDRQQKILYGEDLIPKFHYDSLIKRINSGKKSLLTKILLKQEKKLPLREIDGDCVLLTKPGYTIYGHWLLDILPTQWLFQKICSSFNFPGYVKFILPKNVPKWALRFLSDLFDIQAKNLIFYDPLTEVLAVQKLYAPSMLRIDDVFSPLANEFFEFCKSSVLPKANLSKKLDEKIFVSRRKINDKRVLVNRDKIVDVLNSFGVKEVFPEEMEWADQVALFANAKFVVGEFGSGIHNTVFCSPETKCLIFKPSNSNFIQSGIAALRNQQISYISPESETKSSQRKTAYTVCPNKLREYLNQML